VVRAPRGEKMKAGDDGLMIVDMYFSWWCDVCLCLAAYGII
jgi:hypothetical protein